MRSPSTSGSGGSHGGRCPAVAVGFLTAGGRADLRAAPGGELLAGAPCRRSTCARSAWCGPFDFFICAATRGGCGSAGGVSRWGGCGPRTRRSLVRVMARWRGALGEAVGTCLVVETPSRRPLRRAGKPSGCEAVGRCRVGRYRHPFHHHHRPRYQQNGLANRLAPPTPTSCVPPPIFCVSVDPFSGENGYSSPA